MNFLRRHRALIGYLFIVFVAVVAVELHHLQTTRELDRHDKRSCEQRVILARNQVFVLGVLQDALRAEVHERHVPRVLRQQLLVDLRRAERLLETGNPLRPC